MKLEDKTEYLDQLRKNDDEEMEIKEMEEIIMAHYRDYFNKLLDKIEDEDILPIIMDFNKRKKKTDKH
jgi:hypothetical protein